jgi:uncharacterized protein (TIRG00374 family)
LKSSQIKKILGLALIAGLLIYFILTYNFKEVLRAIAGVKLIFIIPLIFIETIIAFIRTLRLKYLIDPIKKIEIAALFPFYCIGMMANLIMPFLTGQGARVYLLSKKAQLKKTFLATTTLLEFLFDAMALIGLVLLISLFKVMPGDFSPWHLPAVVGIIVLAYIILMTISKSNITGGGVFSKISKRFHPAVEKKMNDAHHSIVSALETLKSTKHFLLVTALSALSWLSQALMVYFLILAFGFSISVWNAVFITILINVMMTIVIAPVNIGTFQAATVAALHPFNIGKSEALAFSFVLHIAVYVPPVILGALFSVKEGLTYKQLEDESDEGMKVLESNVITGQSSNDE